MARLIILTPLTRLNSIPLLTSTQNKAPPARQDSVVCSAPLNTAVGYRLKIAWALAYSFLVTSELLNRVHPFDHPPMCCGSNSASQDACYKEIHAYALGAHRKWPTSSLACGLSEVGIASAKRPGAMSRIGMSWYSPLPFQLLSSSRIRFLSPATP